ncbi:unnamed protein product [Paramecium octaurelia]|uniref:Uncharacterized protein n=1 Tax=Paramecium octaurelia TaxID=43137 RepID=A0A8S1T728_PAROT|nr:unnamed protein product [Paramecium octaurelia]
MEKLKPTLKLIQLNKNTKEMSLQRVLRNQYIGMSPYQELQMTLKAQC